MVNCSLGLVRCGTLCSGPVASGGKTRTVPFMVFTHPRTGLCVRAHACAVSTVESANYAPGAELNGHYMRITCVIKMNRAAAAQPQICTLAVGVNRFGALA